VNSYDRRCSRLEGFRVSGMDGSQGNGPAGAGLRVAQTNSILVGLAVRALPVCR
jgi:hypothetical protein